MKCSQPECRPMVEVMAPARSPLAPACAPTILLHLLPDAMPTVVSVANLGQISIARDGHGEIVGSRVFVGDRPIFVLESPDEIRALSDAEPWSPTPARVCD